MILESKVTICDNSSIGSLPRKQENSFFLWADSGNGFPPFPEPQKRTQTMDYAGAVASNSKTTTNTSRDHSPSSRFYEETRESNGTQPTRNVTRSPTGHHRSNPDDRNNSRDVNARRNQLSQDEANPSTHYKPSRKFAIVLENTQEVTQDQCLRAVADIVSGAHIHYVTRLSGARVCMYLTDENYVEKMCTEGGIVVSGQFIPCRRYVSEATKFVVSNCPPEMTDEELQKLMTPYGKIVSAPSRLRVNTAYDDLRHIKTWRRSIYIIRAHDGPEIPKRIQVTSKIDGSKCMIYIETDQQLCSHCFAPHPEHKCKKKILHEENFPTIHQPVSHRLFNSGSNKQREESRDQQQPVKRLLLPAQVTDLMPNFSTPSTSSASIQNPQDKSPNQEEINVPQNEDTPQEKQNTSNEEIWSDLSKNSSLQVPNQDRKEKTKTATSREKQKKRKDATNQEKNFCTDKLDELISKWSFLSENPSEDNESEEQTQSKKRNLSPDLPLKSQRTKQKRIESDNESEEYETDSSRISESEPFKERKSKSHKKKQKEELAIKVLLTKMKGKENHLTPENFKEFLSKCRGFQNTKNIAALYTENTSELIKQLQMAEDLCSDFNLKRRIGRAAAALI